MIKEHNWQVVYNTMDECYEDELRSVLFELEAFKWMDSDEMCDLWHDRKEGFRWLNTY